ncbi:MAG: VOC family protein [Xanthomonadales bacterium]|nr:VOC family protein [Xanthomonadales bacterium]
MNITPYLFFDGNCRQAFEFYAQCFGVEVKTMISAAQTPMGDPAPVDADDKIMHACIEIGDHMLMASDWNCGPNPTPYAAPRGMRVALGMTSASEAERVFHALAEGGTVDMPLDKTFFAERFGMLTDRFGTPWMINFDGDA